MLEKNNLEFVGIYVGNKRINKHISEINYRDLIIKNEEFYKLYFYGNIGDVKTFSAIYFFDQKNGYVRLDFDVPHFELIEKFEKENLEYSQRNLFSFLKIAEALYYLTKPLYGLMGQEEFAPSVNEITNGNKYLPAFWSFYSKKIVDILTFEKIKSALKGSYILKKLKDGGVFFAISAWDIQSQQTREFEAIKNRLLKLIKSKKIQNLKNRGNST